MMHGRKNIKCTSNFNVNFNVFLRKFTVRPLVKIKDFNYIKMLGTTMIIKRRCVSLRVPLESKGTESNISLCITGMWGPGVA